MKTTNLLKFKTTYALLIMAMAVVVVSCKKNSNNDVPPTAKSSTSELTKDEQIAIAKAGFSTTGATKTTGGYLVEGDIFLTLSDLQTQADFVASLSAKGPKTEHYRTTTIVTGLPRVLKIKVDAGNAQATFTTATTEAIKRYNDLGLQLSLKLLSPASTETADITIKGADLGKTASGATILGQSAFPASGNPGSPIQLNSVYYGNIANSKDLATVVTHEMGHSLGFRHTDYADRTYSCGLTPWQQILKSYGINVADNEGEAGVGDFYIPGTPKGAEPNSWMLACSNGTDRPFTAGDITALKLFILRNNRYKRENQ